MARSEEEDAWYNFLIKFYSNSIDRNCMIEKIDIIKLYFVSIYFIFHYHQARHLIFKMFKI